MSNFINDCINGDALLSEIDDYIARWHESDSEESLHYFLGMTSKEYALFVEDETYLGVIVNAHINKIGVEQVVKSLALAARSDSQAKSMRIERWLRDEGLWK